MKTQDSSIKKSASYLAIDQMDKESKEWKENKKIKSLLKDCAEGFYQQMYFLGKDVMHLQGNQLMHYGFKKSPSQGLKGTSCYTLKLEQGLLDLYGSCAGYYTEKKQIVFLRKRCRFYHWLPAHRLVAGCWSPQDLMLHSAKETLEDLTPLLQWWITYEDQIEERFGQNYREQCYQEWKKVKAGVTWLPPKAALQWIKELIQHQHNTARAK